MSSQELEVSQGHLRHFDAPAKWRSTNCRHQLTFHLTNKEVSIMESISLVPFVMFVVRTKKALFSYFCAMNRMAEISENVQPPKNTTSVVFFPFSARFGKRLSFDC